MQSGGRRPGTGTLFIDAFTGEVLLQVVANERGDTSVGYNLYDCKGQVAADSKGLQRFIDGEEVRDENGELLLLIPAQLEDHIQYRIYNHKGELLTASNGSHTQLYGGIRVEAVKPPTRVRMSATPALNVGVEEAETEMPPAL